MSFKSQALLFFLVISAILNLAFEPIVFVISSMPTHELGHAFCSWLGGRPAVPILMAGVTFISEERSSLFVFLFSVLLIYLFRLFAKKDLKILAGVIVAIAFFFIKFAFILDPLKLKEYILLSGQIGEILIPSVFVSLFFYNYLQLPRWEFWKIIFGAYGFIGFIAAVVKWVNISKGRWPLPKGSILSSDGAGASDGDLNQLLMMGWTDSRFVHFFTTMTTVCVVSVLAVAIYSWIVESKN